jgi:hypothetical protein
MADVPLRCRCGRMRGVANEVASNAGFRFICYCQDCQTFARFLERPDVLDAAGGTVSLARRRKLLAWAKENSALIIEDDYDSEFRYEGRPLDALQGR